MKTSNILYILFIIMFVIIISPGKAMASSVSIKIDENGEVSRETDNFGNNGGMPDDVFYSYFDYRDGTIILKDPEQQYLFEVYSDIKITSTADVTIGMAYMYCNVEIESDYEISFSAYDKTNSNTLTIKNTKVTLPGIHNFHDVIIENSHSDDNKGVAGLIRYDETCFGSLTLDNSTYSGGLNNIIELHISNSILNTGTLLFGPKYAYKMSVENSTFNADTFLINKDYDEVMTIKDSNVTIGTLQGQMRNTYEMPVTIDISNTNFKITRYINYITLKFKDCDIEISGSWAALYFDNCTVKSTGSGSYKEIHAKDTTIDAYNIALLGHGTDIIELENSTLNVEGDIGTGQQTTNVFVNSTLTGRRFAGRQFYVENSNIDVQVFQVNVNNESNAFINSTLNADLLDIWGMDELLIDHSYLYLKRFNGYNARSFKMRNSKIIATTFVSLRELDLYHSYLLVNNTEDEPEDISSYDSNYNHFFSLINNMPANVIATDLDNNLIEPVESEEGRVFYNNVLLRDKINITFKVLNGTWEDGSADDKQLELYSFDKLSNGQIPTNMIASDGYENGSWDSDIMYDELNDDYVFTYTFKKKGIVKGIIEDVTENPKTGVFRYSFITLLLLCVSVLAYRRLTFNRYFKYK